MPHSTDLAVPDDQVLRVQPGACSWMTIRCQVPFRCQGRHRSYTRPHGPYSLGTPARGRRCGPGTVCRAQLPPSPYRRPAGLLPSETAVSPRCSSRAPKSASNGVTYRRDIADIHDRLTELGRAGRRPASPANSAFAGFGSARRLLRPGRVGRTVCCGPGTPGPRPRPRRVLRVRITSRLSCVAGVVAAACSLVGPAGGVQPCAAVWGRLPERRAQCDECRGRVGDPVVDGQGGDDQRVCRVGVVGYQVLVDVTQGVVACP